MSNINWANPVILKVLDPLDGSAILRGAYGMDDWRSPSEFVVRLDYVTYEDGDERYDHVARFDHDGHSVFIWNPPDDGFHIDFYPNGIKNKQWLQTPPPHSGIRDVFDYCRGKLYGQPRAEHLFRVYRGVDQFKPRSIGLIPK